MSEPIIELRQSDVGIMPTPADLPLPTPADPDPAPSDPPAAPPPIYTVGDRDITSIEELTAYMQALLLSSYGEFEDFCHSLIDYNDTLNPEFETWLLAIGKKAELDAWRANLN